MGGREITELVLQIKNGDATRYPDLLRAVSYRIKRTVENRMSGYPPIERENVIDGCKSIGLLKAVKEFNPDCGNFLTFFYCVILNLIKSHMRTAGYSRHRVNISIVQLLSDEDGGDEQDKMNMLLDDRNISSTNLRYHYILNRVKESLSPDSQEILRWVLQGYEPQERKMVRTYGRNHILQALKEMRRNKYLLRLRKEYTLTRLTRRQNV